MKLSLQSLALTALSTTVWSLAPNTPPSAGDGTPAAARADQLDAAPSAQSAATERAAKNAPLAEYQRELIELAFGAASDMPLDPHIKNRSRSQEVAVVACLELDQPERAHAYAAHIANWRRGAAYADIAYYCIEAGALKDVPHLLSLAERESEASEEELKQGWRRDRIRVKIARAHARLGNDDLAAAFEADVVESEAGKVAPVQAALLADDEFEGEMEALAEVTKLGNFDLIRGSLATYVELYGRFYSNEERRDQIEAAVLAAGARVPIQVRIETALSLADVAIDRGDSDQALELVEGAHALLDGEHWRPEHKVPLMAQIATRRHHAGDTEKALGEVEAALALFESGRDTIYDIFRAETLRPVAEAFQALEQTEAALSVYRLAASEGALNPNSRPRAEDLAATACSMAVHGVEPDETLWKSLREIRAGLGDPW